MDELSSHRELNLHDNEQVLLGEHFVAHRCSFQEEHSNEEYRLVSKQHILYCSWKSNEYICYTFAQHISSFTGSWFLFLTFLNSQMKTFLLFPTLNICFVDKDTVTRQHQKTPCKNGTQSTVVHSYRLLSTSVQPILWM